MKDLVKGFDGLPWIVKLILALPFIDGLAWGIYRIAKGVETKDNLMLIAGIIWIFAGATVLWLLDLITIILYKRPTILA
ncbi:MAG: hypothetical protein ACLFRI_05130 [Candidatus Izemoplasmataceae bacterium]